MRDLTPWKLFAALFVVVFLSGLLWMSVTTDESLGAAVTSPAYWMITLVATVASYAGYRRGQRMVHR